MMGLSSLDVFNTVHGKTAKTPTLNQLCPQAMANAKEFKLNGSSQ